MFVIEIRPSEGGDDSVLFSLDLAKCLVKLCRRQKIPVSLDSSNERLIEVEVAKCPSWLKDFAGVHRVQRIPPTEANGRRHTSTITVAIVDGSRPEVEVDLSGVREEVHRGGGKGGQHQNTTDSAVRLVDDVTGITVEVSGRKQWQNRQKAWKEMSRRLSDIEAGRLSDEENLLRTGQIGAGERPNRAWTWNFQRDKARHHESERVFRCSELMRGRGL